MRERERDLELYYILYGIFKGFMCILHHTVKYLKAGLLCVSHKSICYTFGAVFSLAFSPISYKKSLQIMMKVRIDTTIDAEDREYCKKHGLMYSRLVAEGISAHRGTSSGIVQQNLNFMKQKVKTYEEQMDGFIKIAREVMSPEQFQSFIEKV